MAEAVLLDTWPNYLDAEFAAAKPTLSLLDVKQTLDLTQTPRYHAMPPRDLTEAEVTVFRTWYETASQKQSATLGVALAAAQNNIAAQASAHHDENMRLHQSTQDPLQRLEQRADGAIPVRRQGQTAAERKRELDQALGNVPAWRAERKEMAKQERGEAKAGKLAVAMAPPLVGEQLLQQIQRLPPAFLQR